MNKRGINSGEVMIRKLKILLLFGAYVQGAFALSMHEVMLMRAINTGDVALVQQLVGQQQTVRGVTTETINVNAVVGEDKNTPLMLAVNKAISQAQENTSSGIFSSVAGTALTAGSLFGGFTAVKNIFNAYTNAFGAQHQVPVAPAMQNPLLVPRDPVVPVVLVSPLEVNGPVSQISQNPIPSSSARPADGSSSSSDSSPVANSASGIWGWLSNGFSSFVSTVKSQSNNNTPVPGGFPREGDAVVPNLSGTNPIDIVTSDIQSVVNVGVSLASTAVSGVGAMVHQVAARAPVTGHMIETANTVNAVAGSLQAQVAQARADLHEGMYRVEQTVNNTIRDMRHMAQETINRTEARINMTCWGVGALCAVVGLYLGYRYLHSGMQSYQRGYGFIDQKEIVQLLAKKSDKNMKNVYGCTALDLVHQAMCNTQDLAVYKKLGELEILLA